MSLVTQLLHCNCCKIRREFDRSVFDDPNAGLAAPDDILEELEENLHEAHDILAVEDNKTKA